VQFFLLAQKNALAHLVLKLRFINQIPVPAQKVFLIILKTAQI